jgi:arylsulfatase A-like enzyme
MVSLVLYYCRHRNQKACAATSLCTLPACARCCARCRRWLLLTQPAPRADFGWHDVGFHNNSEVRSPTIDALARGGLMLGRHYAYKVCCPTRSSFISGRLPIHVNTDNQNGVASLNGVDIRMVTIAEKLKQGGYSTHAAGKWHAGGHLRGQLPLQRGFDSFVGFLQGWENHFTQQQVFPPNSGGNGASSGPTPYKPTSPVDLTINNQPAFGQNGTYGAYTYGTFAVEAIRNHADVASPFFLYMAFENTHTPLQVPEHYRLPFTPPSNNTDKSMIFGMVACMDESVKNITDALTEQGMMETTLLVWSTDNGGHLGNSQNNYPLRGGKVTEFEKYWGGGII